MAGVKGRSGRRPIEREQDRFKIIDKAWSTVSSYLNDESIPIEKRVEVACKVVVKDMPDKLTDGEGNALPVPIINVYGSRNDQLLRTAESNSHSGETRLPV
jgi:hypothetical protein